MSAIQQAISKNRAVYSASYDLAVSRKAAGGGGFSGFDGGGSLGGDSFQQQLHGRGKRAAMRGWVSSAINALAMRAAKQTIKVGRLENMPNTKPTGKKSVKSFADKTHMPASIKAMAGGQDVEILSDHVLSRWLESPNNLQHRTQFVATFVQNLCLTGWGFVVAGDGTDQTTNEKRVDFFSVPTAWVKPDHTKGPYSQITIQDPSKIGGGDSKPLDRKHFGFAQFPNPYDPLGSLPPTQTQNQAIAIDDNIQSSQTVFFDNGVFPSCIVTVGQNPLGTAQAGIRPRLQPGQRRQIYAAIRRVQSGVSNYGNPAIVDGLIEKIERLSATQNEMGWEKSEKAVRSRILSAFGTHPFILAEEMVGSYAQAYIVQDLFCERVNFFLDMLSTLMTAICRSQMGDNALVVWWEPAEAKDPSLELQKMNSARQRGDINRDEFRQYLGLPPDEEGIAAEIDRQSVSAIANIAAQVTAGKITPEQGRAILEGSGLSAELAKKIAGEGMPDNPDNGGGFSDGLVSGGQSNQNSQENSQWSLSDTVPFSDGLMSDAEAVTAASKALDAAIHYLGTPVSELADGVLSGV